LLVFIHNKPTGLIVTTIKSTGVFTENGELRLSRHVYCSLFDVNVLHPKEEI